MTSPQSDKGRPKKVKEPTPEELYKLSVADELGLGEKVRTVGWGGLSAAETGRVGGYMTKKARSRDKDGQPGKS
jgi:small acid-soluble spore protein F (minor alpha/beta-type SASP)